MIEAPEKKETKKEKDYWDKVDVVLRPLNGLLTALAVALLGYYTSNIVRQQETRDSNERIYTQLMSSRELADSGLRKDMFLSIIEVFFVPKQVPWRGRCSTWKCLPTTSTSRSTWGNRSLITSKRQIDAASGPTKAGYYDRLNQVAKEIRTRQLVLLEQVRQEVQPECGF